MQPKIALETFFHESTNIIIETILAVRLNFNSLVTVTVNFKMRLLIIGNISLQYEMKLAGKPNFLQLKFIKNNKRNP